MTRLRKFPSRYRRKNAAKITPINRIRCAAPPDNTATSTVIISIVMTSAINAAISSVCPYRPLLSPCSFSTGTTTPRDVVERISAIIHGLRTSCSFHNPQPASADNTIVPRKLKVPSDKGPQRSRDEDGGLVLLRDSHSAEKSTSMPDRNIKNTNPNCASKCNKGSSCSHQTNAAAPDQNAGQDFADDDRQAEPFQP